MENYVCLATGFISERQLDIMARSFWPMFKQGLVYTIPLTLVSFLFGILIAIVCSLFVINKVPVLKQIAGIYIWFFRGTPLLVQLFIMYWGICNPIGVSKWVACILALSLNVGAYSAETIRAAILSIDKGQWEVDREKITDWKVGEDDVFIKKY